MKCAVKYAEKINNADKSGRELLYFLDASSAAYLRKTYGYGKTLIYRFLTEAYNSMVDDMEWYSAENDCERGKICNAYYAALNRLKCANINLKEWEDDIVKNHTYKVFSGRRAGKQFQNNRIDFVKHAWLIANSYYAQVMEWLHNDRGFGAARCKKAYYDLRQIYDEYMDHYLWCSDLGDAYCKKMTEEAKKTVEELSISINIRFEEEQKLSS